MAERHGAFSGEHGDGFSRTWFNPELFGPELYAELVALKDLFDPRRLLSPGRKVEGPPLAANLRFGAGYSDRSGWRPRLSYAREGGLDLAVERCFGAGLCKKQTGTMCPPAMASGDEWLTTRARANLLQALVAGAVPLAELGEAEFEDVLGSLRGLQGLRRRVPGGGRHGEPQGRVARRGERASRRAAARPRRRQPALAVPRWRPRRRRC